MNHQPSSSYITNRITMNIKKSFSAFGHGPCGRKVSSTFEPPTPEEEALLGKVLSNGHVMQQATDLRLAVSVHFPSGLRPKTRRNQGTSAQNPPKTVTFPVFFHVFRWFLSELGLRRGCRASNGRSAAWTASSTSSEWSRVGSASPS